MTGRKRRRKTMNTRRKMMKRGSKKILKRKRKREVEKKEENKNEEHEKEKEEKQHEEECTEDECVDEEVDDDDEEEDVMIHVIENLEQENANGAHHYCPFNINLRDKTFEVFDSLRTINKSKRLDEVARCIVAALRMLWEKSYLKQTIMMEKFTPENIDAPKQVVL
ncbi:hypothetical protein ZWY2020_003099 [Hordeum vulgare]|nr:hypothetical protein ZWY2020_003099 [Hordeum vulgare]